jgi:hypothetical protein
MVKRSAPDVIEATHVSIIDRCIDLLASSAEEFSEIGSSKSDEAMAGDDSTARGQFQATLQYHRALSVLDQFIRGFRTRPFYASAGLEEASTVKGDTIDITLRFCSTGPVTVRLSLSHCMLC